MILRRLNTILQTFGFDPKKLIISLFNLPYYFRTLLKYSMKNKNPNFSIKIAQIRPIFSDRSMEAGQLSYHYFFQDIWAANKIHKNNPKNHYDIGSRLDGFISHLLSFRSVTMLDIRPLNKKIPNLEFIQCDATNLNELEDNSIESLSSLHAIEHFGLGRYGDDIDPVGYEKVLKAMQRVLMPNGKLYIGVPVGVERLEFNSQRVFNPNTIIDSLNELTLASFSLVNEEGDYIQDFDLKNWNDMYLAVGLFEFTKK